MPFEALLNVFVEPLESDGHRDSTGLVQNEIVQAGPRLTRYVELAAVPLPPVRGQADIADAGFAQGSEFPLHGIERGEEKGRWDATLYGGIHFFGALGREPVSNTLRFERLL